jgi:hypothetical protein
MFTDERSGELLHHLPDLTRLSSSIAWKAIATP